MRFKILENILLEGIQKDFKDRHGEELFNLFMSVRNKLDKPYNDMSYWMKKSTEELQDFLNNTEIKKSNRETAKEDKSGAKLVAQDGNIKLYFITTYDAMKYYGKGTKWCIAGNYPGHEGRGQEYFDSYIEDYYLDDGYYVITDGRDKYCILTSDNIIHSVWNSADVDVGFKGLPEYYLDVLQKSKIQLPKTFEISDDGILLSYNGKESNIVIPDGVIEIGERAFEGKVNIKSVTIPESVLRIDAFAFYMCFGLEKINLPRQISYIYPCTFYECGITEIEIPDNVWNIGSNAFFACKQLRSVKLPQRLRNIGYKAFDRCSSLESIHVPGRCKTIERMAFSRCDSLKTVVLENGVKEIGRSAFMRDNSLESVSIPSTVTYMESPFFGINHPFNIYYDGTKEKWEFLISDLTDIGDISTANVHFNSKNESYNENGVKMKFRLIERILNEDIESMKKYFPNIPDEQFQSLIELDPTYKPGSKNAGNYGRWILTLANKGKLDNIGHVKDLLTRFNDESKYLKNKDIMRYKTMEEVEDMLNDEDSYKEQSHRQEVRDRQKARKNADLGNEAKKVYEDSDWEVWVPLTYAASCKLGQGASWCTASTESDYYYNHYKNAYGGEYYININKHDPEEKYQFHFESNQFMDVDDYEIDLPDFLSNNSGLKKFYNDIIYSSYVKSWEIKEDGSAVVSASDLAGVLSSRDMSEDFLKSCFRGEIFEYFMDYGSYTDDNAIENYYLSETNTENTKTIESITGLDVNDRGFLETVEEEYPDVYEAIRTACSDAEVTGAENECYEDFNSSLNSASRPLIVNWEFSGGDNVYVKVNMVYLKDNCIDVISYASEEGRDSNDFSSVVSSFISNDWDFSEPRYGWSGFDADTYNDRLSDELYGLGEQK